MLKAARRPAPDPPRHVTLAALFNHPSSGDASFLDDLWRRHYEDDAEAFQLLCEHYAPIAQETAINLKRRSPAFYRGSLDELTSDGVWGLISAIQYNKWGKENFILFARKRIKGWIVFGQRRRFGKHKTAPQMRRDKTVEDFRANYIAENGFQPTPAEEIEALGKLITNPRIVVQFSSPRLVNRKAARFCADEVVNAVDRRILDGECAAVLRRATREWPAVDRKILKLIIDGETRATIIQKTGQRISKQRINGILWQARCNRQLAEYLGVEHAESPALQRSRDKRLLSIQSVPPAKLKIA